MPKTVVTVQIAMEFPGLLVICKSKCDLFNFSYIKLG